MVHIYPGTRILYQHLINSCYLLFEAIVWGGKGMRKVVTGMCEDEDLQGKEKAHTENP